MSEQMDGVMAAVRELLAICDETGYDIAVEHDQAVRQAVVALVVSAIEAELSCATHNYWGPSGNCALADWRRRSHARRLETT